MTPRVLALLLFFAVLPTAEVVEQVVHAVEHVIHGEAPDHTAHHDDSQGDEHGCTGLIHLCGAHVQVTETAGIHVRARTESRRMLTSGPPRDLVDLTSLEPPHRPPIA